MTVLRALADGADSNAPTGDQKMTPWQFAVLLGDQVIVDMFGGQAAGRTAAHCSPEIFKTVLQREDEALVAACLQAGVPLQFGKEEHSPLMIAAANGSVAILARLLDAGATIDGQDRFGDTALMAAVRAGSLDAARLLVRRRADYGLRDEEGRTALSWAIRSGRGDVFDALRRAGATGEVQHVAAGMRQPRAIRQAIERGLALLQASGAEWHRQQKCGACHMQPLLATLAAVAAETGHRIDLSLAREQEQRLAEDLARTSTCVHEVVASAADPDARFALSFLGGAASGFGWLAYSQVPDSVGRHGPGSTWRGCQRIHPRATGPRAQRAGMNSDAYATGIALRALREGAGVAVSSRGYRRGVNYLLRTQGDDGSWFVAKRAASFNRYFESGVPHGKHQFSSFIGSVWATMALMEAAPLCAHAPEPTP